MKNLFKIIAAAGLTFTLASCGAANDVYGNNYPNNYPNGGVTELRTEQSTDRVMCTVTEAETFTRTAGL